MPLIDAHTHPAALRSLRVAAERWFPFGGPPPGMYDAEGRVVPTGWLDFLDREGVDVALLFAEYSPRVTGLQTVEDLLPLTHADPRRLKLVANLNPHYHFPLVEELDRQLDLGAVALKLHPVHGGFPVTEPALYPVYLRCRERDVPVIVHTGTSTFPGASNRYGDPALVGEVLRDVPGLVVVLAHGGRGWHYDTAAFLALTQPTVWIDVAGLPPAKLATYYARHDLARLARRWLFGSDWPGAPGIRRNADALAGLGLPADLLEDVRWRNADVVFRLGLGGVDGPPPRLGGDPASW